VTHVNAPNVCFVVPAYNEGVIIGQVLAKIVQSGYSVVCVDDGSRDNTALRAKEAGAIVVTHPANMGQGASLQTGIEFALRRGAEYIVTFDADGQHQLSDAIAMISMARRDGLAIVFGSRFLDNRTQIGFLRKAILRTATWFTTHSTGLNLTDAHNGLRVIRRDAARQLNLRHNGMAHATEIVRQLQHTKLPWAEYPVHVLYTDYSKSKGQSLWNSVNILVDLIVR